MSGGVASVGNRYLGSLLASQGLASHYSGKAYRVSNMIGAIKSDGRIRRSLVNPRVHEADYSFSHVVDAIEAGVCQWVDAYGRFSAELFQAALL